MLGGGSNVVLPDEGVDGTVLRVAVHGLAAEHAGDRVLLTAAAGRGVGVLRRALRRRPARRRRGAVGHPRAWSAPASCRTSARTARTSRRPSSACGRTTGERGEVVELTGTDCRFAYRTSAFKAEPDRWVVLAVTFSLGSGRAVGAGRLRRAGPAARRRGRRARAAVARCARPCSPCAGARAWCSTPPTPTPAAPARSSPTRCSPASRCRRCASASPCAAAPRCARPSGPSPTAARRCRRPG